jgi:pyruvate dehydrogenase E2 component (dihydrolipoamide acetyltransferase)
VKAVGAALADHPYLNARWIDNRGIYLVESINVGIAVAVEDGLVVPVIRDAAGKKLMEVAAEMARLLAKAREDRLTREEMSGGSFTITNLGMFGIDSFTPIVNPPEAAILGVGRIAERPAGRDGQLVLRPLMTLSLSVDHRVVDGAPAARFLQRMKELIEEPYLLLEGQAGASTTRLAQRANRRVTPEG